jgi:urease accessory protein
MTETNAEAFLTGLQLSDSFLPVGAYTMSYGLERFIQNDVVTDADDLTTLLEDYLRAQIGPCDVVAITAVHEAAMRGALDRVLEIDATYHSLQLVREFRESSTKSGTKLLELVTTVEEFDLLEKYRRAVDADDASGHYPIVLGLATARWGLTDREACLIHAYSFVTGLLGAAQRLLGLGHTRLQEVLQEIKRVIVEVIDTNAGQPPAEMQTFAPWIEIMGMEHERADLRLFLS